MDLSVDFMGIKLKNPVIIAAGPWTRNGEMIKKAIQAGAGAVVTETILSELRPTNIRPRLTSNSSGGVQNIRLYSEIELDEWEDEIAIAKSSGGVVIANVLGHTPSEMAYIASRLEKFGADAIELGIASPHGGGIEVLASDSQKIYEITQKVSDSVKIPVMVKMSQGVTNIAKLARSVEKGGASAISAINTIRSILGVDINTGKPFLPTYGGYSGAPIRPIGLAAVATIAQATRLPVCGIGGIETFENVLEYIMLGASAVQIGTAVMLNGYEYINTILTDLSSWMEKNNIQSIDSIKGKALHSLKSFEEIEIEPLESNVYKKCLRESCKDCVSSCLYSAIHKNLQEVYVDPEKCTGCGLCISRCPDRNFRLILKV